MAYKSSSIFSAAKSLPIIGTPLVTGSAAASLLGSAGNYVKTQFTNPNLTFAGSLLSTATGGNTFSARSYTTPKNTPSSSTFTQANPWGFAGGAGGQTLKIGNAATAGQGTLIGAGASGQTSWGGQGASGFWSSLGSPIYSSIGGTGRMASLANRKTIKGYTSRTGVKMGGNLWGGRNEQKSFRGVDERENLPTSGPLLRKTISGPDFTMSKHSAASKTGTIKTSEGTFGIEDKKEIDEATTEADKAQARRVEEITKESKSRAFAEAQARYARRHPAQKLEKPSFAKKLLSPLTSTIAGGIRQLGQSYTGSTSLGVL